MINRRKDSCLKVNKMSTGDMLLFLALVCLIFSGCESAVGRRDKRSLMKLMMHIRYDPVRLIRVNHVYDITKEIMKSWRDIIPTILFLPITANLPDTSGITKYISQKPVAIRTIYDKHAFTYPKVATLQPYSKNPYPREYLQKMTLPNEQVAQMVGSPATNSISYDVVKPNRLAGYIVASPERNVPVPKHKSKKPWIIQKVNENDLHLSPLLVMQGTHRLPSQNIKHKSKPHLKKHFYNTESNKPIINNGVPLLHENVPGYTKEQPRTDSVRSNTTILEQSLKLPWPKDYKKLGNSKSFENNTASLNEMDDPFSVVIFRENSTSETKTLFQNATNPLEDKSLQALDEADVKPIIWTKHVKVNVQAPEHRSTPTTAKPERNQRTTAVPDQMNLHSEASHLRIMSHGPELAVRSQSLPDNQRRNPIRGPRLMLIMLKKPPQHS